ncbi:hypothetical protein [Xanthomarina sp. F2636L]|uniref:hypothetical protein n=1 Tax=Xanthomarina sp. F2636L TaxID=2996018 RepID=UPI00225DFAD0|nr:hypothetical protein [Xanthomarina sp. F2636L]MCX7551764.1 hypothetical protein [Xanthomarina sp. F2636L]
MEFRTFQFEMKTVLYFIFFISYSIFGQEPIETTFVSKIPFEADCLIGIDNFGTVYYINKNTLYKIEDKNNYSYSNVQFGKITSANSFNPLKITVFYEDFNTAFILDNRFAEILKIDFNSLEYYKNVSFVSTANDNALWVFNEDIQQLELFDYKTHKIRATTLPIQSKALDLKSNYNYAWILTEKFLYKYNYFGSLVYKIENMGYTSLVESNDKIFLVKNNSLTFFNESEKVYQLIETPELLTKQFLVTNETVYIYDSKILHKFQLNNK